MILLKLIFLVAFPMMLINTILGIVIEGIVDSVKKHFERKRENETFKVNINKDEEILY